MIKQALAKETEKKSSAKADNLTGVSRSLTEGGPPGAAHGFFLESCAGGPLIKQALAKETEKAYQAGSKTAPPSPSAKQLPAAGALAKAKDAVRRGLSKRANFDMRVPQRYWGKTLEQLSVNGYQLAVKAKRAFDAVMNGESLFLTGSTGSGKTHLAISLIFEWCAESLSANEEGAIYHGKGRPLFVPAPEILLEIKETWDKGDKGKERGATTEKEILDRCSNPPLLVIDDLGAEKASEWSRGVFYLLVDRLYRNGKQVIITSNMDLAGLSRTLDDRVASRICEMGAVIDMGKTDWRVEGRRG